MCTQQAQYLHFWGVPDPKFRQISKNRQFCACVCTYWGAPHKFWKYYPWAFNRWVCRFLTPHSCENIWSQNEVPFSLLRGVYMWTIYSDPWTNICGGGRSRFQIFGHFLPFFTNYRVLSTLYGFKLQLYTSLNYFCTPQASFSLPSIFSTHFWSFSHGTLSKVPKPMSGELFPLPDQKWQKNRKFSKIFSFAKT